MGFSDRILGKKNANGSPHIDSVVAHRGTGRRRVPHHGFRPAAAGTGRPKVSSEKSREPSSSAPTDLLWREFLTVPLPAPLWLRPTATSAIHRTYGGGADRGKSSSCDQPALDAEGNIYVTFSGSRGQKVPVCDLQDRHELRRKAAGRQR